MPKKTGLKATIKSASHFSSFSASGGVLVNGKSYGPNSQMGISKQQGVQFGSEIDVAKSKVRGKTEAHS